MYQKELVCANLIRTDLAEKELREALAAATELTGEPLPISQREQEEQRVQEMLRSLNGKGGKK